MPEDDDFDGQLVEEFLRFLRGRGPRPQTERLPEDVRAKHEDLFHLLEAIVDADAVESPPLEEDPVAVRLGLTGEPRETPDRSEGFEVRELSGVPPAISSALEEVVHQLNREVEVFPVTGNGELGHPANGFRPLAECRSLGEMILVCSTPKSDLSAVPSLVARMFAENPMFTAVAVVSSETNHAVVLTHADCVRALDPKTGWVEPMLPASPEPLELTLGRYLSRSLPRWDEIARLDDLLLLAEADEDISQSVAESLRNNLERKPKIPARKKALEQLRQLPEPPLESVVHDVRRGGLSREALIRRLREISGAQDS